MAGVRKTGYSRLVQLLKYVLPVAALVLVSLIFLVSREDLDGGIQFSLRDLEKLDDGLRLESPKLSILKEDGGSILLQADWALPADSSHSEVTLSGIEARLVPSDQSGSEIVITANDGELKSEENLLSLTDDVRIDLGDEGILTTQTAQIDLEAGGIVMPEEVLLDTDSLRIRADGASISADDPDGDRNSVIQFNGQVKVLAETKAKDSD